MAITDAGRAALARDRRIRAGVIQGRIRGAPTGEDVDLLAAAVPLLERLCHPPEAGDSRLS